QVHGTFGKGGEVVEEITLEGNQMVRLSTGGRDLGSRSDVEAISVEPPVGVAGRRMVQLRTCRHDDAGVQTTGQRHASYGPSAEERRRDAEHVLLELGIEGLGTERRLLFPFAEVEIPPLRGDCGTFEFPAGSCRDQVNVRKEGSLLQRCAKRQKLSE